MTQDSRPTILVVQKVIHEKVNGGSEGINGEISDVFCKGKQGKSHAEREVRKGWLRIVQVAPSKLVII
jgi:hypothetical protein